MSHSLFTIALMISYIGAARAFHWSSDSFWGLAFLFATALFFILREAFPNRLGVLNARVSVIHALHQTIKRKNFEIETLKSTLNESRDELRGMHALWMNTKSDPSSAQSRLKDAQRDKTGETILATQDWNLLASHSEFSDEERMEIASNIIQRVLPVSNFRNHSMIEDAPAEILPSTEMMNETAPLMTPIEQMTFIEEVSAEEETAEVQFEEASVEEEIAEVQFEEASVEEEIAEVQFEEASAEEEIAEVQFEEASAEEEIALAHFEETSVAQAEATVREAKEKELRHFEAYDYAYDFNSAQ